MDVQKSYDSIDLNGTIIASFKDDPSIHLARSPDGLEYRFQVFRQGGPFRYVNALEVEALTGINPILPDDSVQFIPPEMGIFFPKRNVSNVKLEKMVSTVQEHALGFREGEYGYMPEHLLVRKGYSNDTERMWSCVQAASAFLYRGTILPEANPTDIGNAAKVFHAVGKVGGSSLYKTIATEIYSIANQLRGRWGFDPVKCPSKAAVDWIARLNQYTEEDFIPSSHTRDDSFKKARVMMGIASYIIGRLQENPGAAITKDEVAGWVGTEKPDLLGSTRIAYASGFATITGFEFSRGPIKRRRKAGKV